MELSTNDRLRVKVNCRLQSGTSQGAIGILLAAVDTLVASG